MVTVHNMAPVQASTLANHYVVNSDAYTNAVYPINKQNPTKTITEQHEETKVTKKTNTTVVVILAIGCAIFLIIALVMGLCFWSKEEGGALNRNQSSTVDRQGLI
jgi:hypothetical protein